MRWFWYSLIGFCLLMCSCKTQKSARLINEVSKENIQTELFKFEALTDTSRLHKIEIDKSKLKIIETIKITEYDAQSGKPIKETEAKRETTQDSDKVSTEEEIQSVTDCNGLEVEHFRDLAQNIDSEIEEESIGGNEPFVKWFGIAIGCSIGLFIVYLLEKYRVN